MNIHKDAMVNCFYSSSSRAKASPKKREGT